MRTHHLNQVTSAPTGERDIETSNTDPPDATLHRYSAPPVPSMYQQRYRAQATYQQRTADMHDLAVPETRMVNNNNEQTIMAKYDVRQPFGHQSRYFQSGSLRRRYPSDGPPTDVPAIIFHVRNRVRRQNSEKGPQRRLRYAYNQSYFARRVRAGVEGQTDDRAAAAGGPAGTLW